LVFKLRRAAAWLSRVGTGALADVVMWVVLSCST